MAWSIPTVLRSERSARPSAGAACSRKACSRWSVSRVFGVVRNRRASRPTTILSASRGTAMQTEMSRGRPESHGSVEEEISSWSRAMGFLSRSRSCTMPVSRETERLRKARVPSPCVAMQRKNGLTASGAHKRAPSARARSALHLAAQPEVCERFSHRASSAKAFASARPTISASSGMRLSLPRRLEARNGGFQVLVDLEHRIELGHLELLHDLRTRVKELGVTAFLLRVRERAHQSAEPRAVEKADFPEVHEQMDVPFLEQARHCPLEGGLRVPDDEVAIQREDRDPPVLSSREVHEV